MEKDINIFNYGLFVDCSTQWFTSLVYKKGDEIVFFDVPNSVVDCEFCKNIYGRDLILSQILFDGQSWYGWSLSRSEYDRIRKLITLSQAYDQFISLSKINF